MIDLGNNPVEIDGLELRYTLSEHSKAIYSFAWNSKGDCFASASMDRSVRIWSDLAETAKVVISGFPPWGNTIAWAPKDHQLALGVARGSVILLNADTGRKIMELLGHADPVSSVLWSPDGELLLSQSIETTLLWETRNWSKQYISIKNSRPLRKVQWTSDSRFIVFGFPQEICFWDVSRNVVQHSIDTGEGHTTTFSCSPAGRLVATGRSDGTIKLWDATSGFELLAVDGPVAPILEMAFSFDGEFLATVAEDRIIRIWLTESGDQVATIPQTKSRYFPLNFHPSKLRLATGGIRSNEIRLWDIDATKIKKNAATVQSMKYGNAKIVIVGDSGVGKSGLALVLLGNAFAATDSTHGRRVSLLETEEIRNESGQIEFHEVLLWDLAGQPDYRLIHQLHLNDVEVALIVFTSQSQLDLFSGVRYWHKALKQAERSEARKRPMKKFLVAARCDTGSPPSRDEVQSIINELQLDAFIQTSAKNGSGIAELRELMTRAIDWDKISMVNSTVIFQSIRRFLLQERPSGRAISSLGELYGSFVRYQKGKGDSISFEQFEDYINRLASRDILRRLSFGKMILLQGEMIDSYASAIVNAAKSDPEGMGYIDEAAVKEGRFEIPLSERVHDTAQETLLLIATIEDLLKHEIAIRENTDKGPVLIFPSQLTKDRPDLQLEGKAVVFRFQGALMNIYATLIVRLARSGIFVKESFWRNAAIFTVRNGGSYGISLLPVAEAAGELQIFYGPGSNRETESLFEYYIYEHIHRLAIPDSLTAIRLPTCLSCGYAFDEKVIRDRKHRGLDDAICAMCETRVRLLEFEYGPTDLNLEVFQMNRSADIKRSRDEAISTLQGKVETGDFDVFICHNVSDKVEIFELTKQLKEYGLLPWLDSEQLRPGSKWADQVAHIIEKVKTAVVVVGRSGIGPWQDQEVKALMEEFVKRQRPLIPVLLKSATARPSLPFPLAGIQWVDFRELVPNPMEQLLWGITGKRDLFKLALKDHSKGINDRTKPEIAL